MPQEECYHWKYLSAQQLLTDLKLEELSTIAEGQLLLARLEQITSR